MAPSTPCPDTGRGCLQPRGEGTGSIAHPWWDLERATSPLRLQLPLCRMCLGDPCPAGPPVQVFCSCVCPFSGTLSPLASKALSFSGFQLGPSLESCRELVKGSLSTRRHFHSRLGRGADTYRFCKCPCLHGTGRTENSAQRRPRFPFLCAHPGLSDLGVGSVVLCPVVSQQVFYK